MFGYLLFREKGCTVYVHAAFTVTSFRFFHEEPDHVSTR
jgi:hypothetical protein